MFLWGMASYQPSVRKPPSWRYRFIFPFPYKFHGVSFVQIEFHGAKWNAGTAAFLHAIWRNNVTLLAQLEFERCIRCLYHLLLKKYRSRANQACSSSAAQQLVNLLNQGTWGGYRLAMFLPSIWMVLSGWLFALNSSAFIIGRAGIYLGHNQCIVWH